VEEHLPVLGQVLLSGWNIVFISDVFFSMKDLSRLFRHLSFIQ